MTDHKAYPSSIVNGTTAVRTYKRNGLELSAAPLEEWEHFITDNIRANKSKDLILKDQINYAVKIESIWVDAKFDDNPNTNPSGWFQLQVDYLKAKQRITSHKLYLSQFAWSPPPIILTPDLTIRLTPTKDVNNIWFFCKQVALTRTVCFL